jgi:hypothetical protein
MTTPFEYEVALSFLEADEPLALRFARELEGRASVFVYSEHQKELAGTDGVDRFTQVFGTEARVCVILYRDGWGKTKWTRVEEGAVKNRGITYGWDFLLLISLDGTSPIWLPRTQLWLGWERFGIEAGVAVIERKITEAGGSVSAQSALGFAALLGERQEREAARARLLKSQKGVDLARAEVSRLFDILAEKVTRVQHQAPSLRIALRRVDSTAVAINSPGYAVSLAWFLQYIDSLEYSSLCIMERAGPYLERPVRGGPLVVRDVHATFTVDDRGLPAWIHDDEPDRLYSTEALSERYLLAVVSHAQDEPRRSDSQQRS